MAQKRSTRASRPVLEGKRAMRAHGNVPLAQRPARIGIQPTMRLDEGKGSPDKSQSRVSSSKGRGCGQSKRSSGSASRSSSVGMCTSASSSKRRPNRRNRCSTTERCSGAGSAEGQNKARVAGKKPRNQMLCQEGCEKGEHPEGTEVGAQNRYDLTRHEGSVRVPVRSQRLDQI